MIGDVGGIAERGVFVMMLGALAGTGKVPFDADVLKETMLDTVPARFRDINEKAFALGYARTGR